MTPISTFNMNMEPDSAHQLDWLLSMFHFVFDIVKAAVGPFIAFLILAFLHEPYRVARQKYETYFSWLVVLPSEIKRLEIEASVLVNVLKSLSMPTHITTTLTVEFLLAARVPMMSHYRAEHLIPLITETISELTEALQHISRYNERVAAWTGGLSPLPTNSILGLNRSSEALLKLERRVKEEITLAPTHKPRLLRYWFQADRD